MQVLGSALFDITPELLLFPQSQRISSHCERTAAKCYNFVSILSLSSLEGTIVCVHGERIDFILFLIGA